LVRAGATDLDFSPDAPEGGRVGGTPVGPAYITYLQAQKRRGEEIITTAGMGETMMVGLRLGGRVKDDRFAPFRPGLTESLANDRALVTDGLLSGCRRSVDASRPSAGNPVFARSCVIPSLLLSHDPHYRSRFKPPMRMLYSLDMKLSQHNIVSRAAAVLHLAGHAQAAAGQVS